MTWSKTLALLLTCAGAVQPVAWALGTEQNPRDNGNGTRIQLEIADENLQQFAFQFSKPEILERVSRNLGEWHYPVKSADSYSHKLSVTLGKISKLSTPVGVSFSSGNSDPRAMNFQQADVLPVSCSLTKTAGSSAPAKHQTTFSAGPLLEQNHEAQILEKLVNDISTACLAVLEEQKLAVVADRPDSRTFKPTWFPDVQVEVKQVPVVGESANESGSAPASSATSNDGATSTEVKTQGEGRKQIIIHNQGSPLILEMGHERR